MKRESRTVEFVIEKIAVNRDESPLLPAQKCADELATSRDAHRLLWGMIGSYELA